MTTPWEDRICERCRIRAVGVTGPDPHLCHDCNMQVSLEEEDRRSVAENIKSGYWAYLKQEETL